MVFVKVVLWTQGKFSNERGLRLDESKPVASQYRNIAERLGLLADFETHRLFMLSARKGEEYLVTSIVQDNEVPANVPGLDRACRMLFIDDFEGRRMLESSGQTNVQHQLDLVDARTWTTEHHHNVFLCSLRYTTQAEGSGKLRVLTNGFGHLPGVNVTGVNTHSFNQPLCDRLGLGRPAQDFGTLIQPRASEPSEMDLLRQSADLLSYKLGIEQGTGREHLGYLHPQLISLSTCNNNALLVCCHDVGPFSCNERWADPADFLCDLNMHNPGLTVDYQHQLWLLFTSLGLCEEMTAKSEVGSPRRSPKASPLIEPEPFTRSPQIHTLIHNPGAPEPVQLPEPVLRPPAAKVAAKVEVEYSPIVLQVVEDTLLDIIDVVEAAETAREQLAWCEEEAAADEALLDDQMRFHHTMDQLFKAYEVDLDPTEINLSDHIKVDDLLKTDLTDAQSTPFSGTIRTLVERFGQTVLMVEDLDEAISSMIELDTLVTKVDEIMPAPKVKVSTLHHNNHASSGPGVSDFPTEDLVNKVQCTPQSKQAYNNQEALAASVIQPTETFSGGTKGGEFSGRLVKTESAVPQVMLSLADVMKEDAATSQALVLRGASAHLLIRIYKSLRSQHATVVSTFKTMDKDNNGMIDARELGNALRKLRIEVSPGEVQDLIVSIEQRAVELEKDHDSSWKSLSQHTKQRKADIDGYTRHVDGFIQYKELLDCVTEAARLAGLTTEHKTVVRRKGGILAASPAARSLKGVKGVKALNSMYRTHERVTGRGGGGGSDLQALDSIGPINPVDHLDDSQFGVLSADNKLYPVSAAAAKESASLYHAEHRIVGIDAAGWPVVQTVAELLTGFAMDPSCMHGSALARVIDTELGTLFEAACAIGNMRLLVLVLDKMLAQYNTASLLEQLSGSFLMSMTAAEWHWMESSIVGCASAMDLLWCARCVTEFDSDEDLEACRNIWKQMYAELRFQSTVRDGIDHIDESELEVWDQFIGRLVKSVDLSQTDARDDTVAVTVATCPNIEYLDLHDSKVTDSSVNEIIRGLPQLLWLNIEETAITGDGVENLGKAYPNLELLG